MFSRKHLRIAISVSHFHSMLSVGHRCRLKPAPPGLNSALLYSTNKTETPSSPRSNKTRYFLQFPAGIHWFGETGMSYQNWLVWIKLQVVLFLVSQTQNAPALCRGQFTLQWPEPAPLLPRRCSAHHIVSALGGVISLSLFMRTFETPQLYQCGLRPNAKEISEFLFLTALRRKQ